MSSLPVPLSPRSSTETPRGATRSARSSTRRISGAWATIRRRRLGGELTAQHLVLLGQPLALGLQPLELAGAVERHAGERRHRLEEAAILDAELRAGASPRLLVEQGEEARKTPR